MNSTTLPILNPQRGNARELIVSVLSTEWPLSTKEIFSRLKRTHAYEGTYQAAHKTITQAVEGGMLVREGKGYALSREWIDGVKKFGADIDSAYSTNGVKINPENFEGSAHLKFDRFIMFGQFLVNEFFAKFPNPKRKAGVCNMEHCYAIIGASDKEHESLRKAMGRYSHYGLCKGNTFFDQWCTNYLRNMGKTQVNGVEYSVGDETFVVGDFVMQAFFAPELKERIDRIYGKIKCPEDIDMKEYFDTILNRKTEINVLITKSPSLADAIRHEVIGICEKKGGGK
ncbi:hypothetical protein KJ891_01305 [Candidatus Micrarchaeota archaeon]|nr:hypothetical protein [Candidatus Micrarchaeota archaeon]